MEIIGGLAGNQGATAAGTERATAAGTERALAAGIAAGVERLIGLLRSLSPADGRAATAGATRAGEGPGRTPAPAVRGGGKHPPMRHLIARLKDPGRARREGAPADGRV